MTSVAVKTGLSLVIVILLIGLALTTQDIYNAKLYASIGITFGAFAFHQLSKPDTNRYDEC